MNEAAAGLPGIREEAGRIDHHASAEVRKTLFAKIVDKFINPFMPIFKFLNDPMGFITKFMQDKKERAAIEAFSERNNADVQTQLEHIAGRPPVPEAS